MFCPTHVTFNTFHCCLLYDSYCFYANSSSNTKLSTLSTKFYLQKLKNLTKFISERAAHFLGKCNLFRRATDNSKLVEFLHSPSKVLKAYCNLFKSLYLFPRWCSQRRSSHDICIQK